MSTRSDLAPWLGFEITLEGASTATLACDSDTDPEARHALEVGPGSTSLLGSLADHTYTRRLRVQPSDDLESEPLVVWTEQATTPPLPELLPELVLTVQAGSEIEGGWLVFDQTDQGPTERTLITDGQGRIRWHRAIEAHARGVSVVWAPPHVVAAGGHTLPPSTFGLDAEEVFRGPDLNANLDDHHEARWVDVDGTPGVLALTSTELPQANRTTKTYQKGSRAEVHAPATGSLLWAWDVAGPHRRVGPTAVPRRPAAQQRHHLGRRRPQLDQRQDHPPGPAHRSQHRGGDPHPRGRR